MKGPYRDGKVHVLREQCSTCIFRPGNLMHLQEGRVKQMVDQASGDESVITCHQTLPYGGYEAEPAVCRGYWDAQKDRVSTLQIAQRLGVVVEDDPPTKKKGS